jgi:hypothetical protein
MQQLLLPRTHNTITMDDFSSSSSYSASSLIELSRNFVYQSQRQPPQSDFPRSPNSSNSSYGYESLIELTLNSPWKNILASSSSLHGRSPLRVSPSEHPAVEALTRDRTCPGVTTPEDVSLSSDDNADCQSNKKPQLPVKYFSTQRKNRSSSSCFSDDSPTDLYLPSPRASIDPDSVNPPQGNQPVPLKAYGELYI